MDEHQNSEKDYAASIVALQEVLVRLGNSVQSLSQQPGLDRRISSRVQGELTAADTAMRKFWVEFTKADGSA